MSVIGVTFSKDFQVLRQIARGAHSQVYLASDGHEVKAVKFFEPRFAPRADSEYRIAKALSHPHLNPIEDKLELLGRPVLVMPFVEGYQLEQWLAQPQGSEGFLGCFVGVLEALRELHERGIIHQDVKPENILVDKSGHATLIDFDLAVYKDAGEDKGVAGTVAYLSPEQARGEPAEFASDLYAAGIIMYLGLTGQVPFTGAVKDVLKAHREEQPRPASSINAELRPFDSFFERLLTKNPSERFSSADEVLDALNRVRRESGDIEF